MKKFSIKMVLPALFLGFGMISCNSDDAGTNGLPGDKMEGEGKGYISLNLTHTETGVKSAPDEDYGIEPEYRVDDVRVVLYKVKDGIAAYTFDMDASNNGGHTFFQGDDVATITTPGSRRFTTKAKEIEVDDYYLLVLVNSPAEVLAMTQPGNHFDEFGNSIYNLGNDYSKLIGTASPRYNDTNASQYSFFMSNFKKELIIEGKRALYDNESDAEANPVPVIVDRAVAKVKLKKDELVTEKGTVEGIAWKLDITNKQTFWVRHAAKTLYGDWEPRGETDRTILYAEDPNFDYISQLRNPDLTISPQTYFNYITKNDLTNDDCEWEYVAENTMEAGEQWEDVMTRMVLRLNFIPTGFSSGDSYYWWRGYALTVEDVKNYAADVTTIPSTLNGLQQTLQELIAMGYNFNNPVAINHPEIEFYKGGISYYATPIRHFNDTQAPGKKQYGRYGVVRNNQYTLNLKKITGPGKPDIPGPEPDEDKYLSVDIEIQNWYSRDTQDIKE
ncbi:MAG: Mfa1 family fimbria major subunit [Tannerellaceae bacterium]|nr:Mfa1 family fimbria major subunit [Tannerellaceae bacterium]